MRPTAEINGINGGYTGPGGKTIVPADATAKLSFRLVGRQDPTEIARLVDAFVADQAGPGVTAQMRWTPGGVRPIVVPVDHPATLAARRSLAVAFDAETVLVTREGGSGPEAELASTTGAPMIFLGVMTDDDQIHAPDERARLDLLRRGAEAAAHLWRELGGLDRTALS
jgi:acetylornithine deacetylase/succinyl-diaminopimelate desuccinylase-like protein